MCATARKSLIYVVIILNLGGKSNLEWLFYTFEIIQCASHYRNKIN